MNGVVVVVHMLTVYITVELVSKSKKLWTMLHGTISVVPANVIVVDAVVDVDSLEVTLRKCRRFAQKSWVPAAATDALQISRDAMRMLTIRKTGFSAVRTYAMCQSFIFLHAIYSMLSLQHIPHCRPLITLVI